MTNKELYSALKTLIWRAAPHQEQDELIKELDKRFMYLEKYFKSAEAQADDYLDDWRDDLKSWKEDFEDTFKAVGYAVIRFFLGKYMAKDFLEKRFAKDKRSPKSWEL